MCNQIFRYGWSRCRKQSTIKEDAVTSLWTRVSLLTIYFVWKAVRGRIFSIDKSLLLSSRIWVKASSMCTMMLQVCRGFALEALTIKKFLQNTLRSYFQVFDYFSAVVIIYVIQKTSWLCSELYNLCNL